MQVDDIDVALSLGVSPVEPSDGGYLTSIVGIDAFLRTAAPGTQLYARYHDAPPCATIKAYCQPKTARYVAPALV